MSPSTPPRTNRPANTPAMSRKRKANNEELRILTARNEARKKLRTAVAELKILMSKQENKNTNNFYYDLYQNMLNQLEKNILKLSNVVKVPTRKEMNDAKLLLLIRRRQQH